MLRLWRNILMPNCSRTWEAWANRLRSTETMQSIKTFASAPESTCLVSTVSQPLMDKCEIERNPISLAGVKLQGDAHLKCCTQMCYSLALITKGSVRTLVRCVDQSNGGEAWRLIHNRHAPDTQNRQYASVQSYCHLVIIHTTVKMEDAPALLKLLKSECPDIWIRLPGHKWSKSWLHTEELSRLLDFCGKDMSIKFYWDLDGRPYQTGNACWCIASKVYSCLCTWMTSNWLERSKVSIPCWRNGWNTLIWRVHIVSWLRVLGMHWTRM